MFRPKTGDLHKKKRSSPYLQGIFSGRNQKFKRFLRPISGVLRKKKVFSKFARDFSAEIGNSSGFSGRKQMLYKKRKKNGLHPKNIMKCGVSPQDTPIWASICTPVAPSLLISSVHSPRLGGHKQSFDTVQILSEGAEARNQGFAKKMGGLELKVKVVCVWQRAWGETFSSWAF